MDVDPNPIGDYNETDETLEPTYDERQTLKRIQRYRFQTNTETTYADKDENPKQIHKQRYVTQQTVYQPFLSPLRNTGYYPPAPEPSPPIREKSDTENIRTFSDLLYTLDSSTNCVFLLRPMVARFTSEDFDVHTRRSNVKQQLIDRYPESSNNNTFTMIPAELISDAFELIDLEFFGGALLAVFEHHQRVVQFRIVNDTELPTQAGSFSRAGVVHYITINEQMLMRPYEGSVNVCGVPCTTRLDALLIVLEHEIAHLVVYTNWICCEDAHGEQFQSVAYCFFRHTSCTHALPVSFETKERISTIGKSSECHSVSNCAPPMLAIRDCTIPRQLEVIGWSLARVEPSKMRSFNLGTSSDVEGKTVKSTYILPDVENAVMITCSEKSSILHAVPDVEPMIVDTPVSIFDPDIYFT